MERSLFSWILYFIIWCRVSKFLVVLSLGDGKAPSTPLGEGAAAAAGSLLPLLPQSLLPSCLIPALSDCRSVFLYIRQQANLLLNL